MSTRKTQTSVTAQPPVTPVRPRPRKKVRGPRVRLTHMEIRRGDTLRLRIAVADDAMSDIGLELGALIKKIAPSAPAVAVMPEQDVAEVVSEAFVSEVHAEHDHAYHANLRAHLAGLFTSLCDESLADALEIARQERDRRAEGSN